MKATTGIIENIKNKRQWKLHQQLGVFAQSLNTLPDATAARANKPQGAPLALLPMVF